MATAYRAFSKQQTVCVGPFAFSTSGPALSFLKASSTALQIHGLCLYTTLPGCLYSVVLGVHFQKQFFLLCKSTVCLLQKTEKLQGAKKGRENYHISTFLKKKNTCWLTLFISSVFLKFLTLKCKCYVEQCYVKCYAKLLNLNIKNFNTPVYLTTAFPQCLTFPKEVCTSPIYLNNTSME